jgi:hypothetical protein
MDSSLSWIEEKGFGWSIAKPPIQNGRKRWAAGAALSLMFCPVHPRVKPVNLDFKDETVVLPVGRLPPCNSLPKTSPKPKTMESNFCPPFAKGGQGVLVFSGSGKG